MLPPWRAWRGESSLCELFNNGSKSTSPRLLVEQRWCCCMRMHCSINTLSRIIWTLQSPLTTGDQTFYLSSIKSAADNFSHLVKPGERIACCQRALKTPAGETSFHSRAALTVHFLSPPNLGSGRTAAVKSISQRRVRSRAVKDSHSEDSDLRWWGFWCFQRAFRSAYEHRAHHKCGHSLVQVCTLFGRLQFR